MKWYRELVRKKFDGSKQGKPPGHPPTEAENTHWGFKRIGGELLNA